MYNEANRVVLSFELKYKVLKIRPYIKLKQLKSCTQKLQDFRQTRNTFVAKNRLCNALNFVFNPGTANRDADFSNKAANFVEHGQKLAETASLVANFGAPSADKQLLDQINATGQEVGHVSLATPIWLYEA